MIYLSLFLTFIKIGAFTFGGGYAMLPLIQQEVLRHGWLSKEELLNFVAISESTPGPFAVNISTYVGCQTAGIVGAFCATFGVVLPSFVIILLIAKAYERFSKSKLVNGSMIGLKGAVVGLIGTAVLSTADSVVSLGSIMTAEFVVTVILFAVVLICLLKNVHPILIILVSAVLGIVVKGVIL